MQTLAWCLLLCACPASAHAADLFRCVASDGGVSYQDTPCGQGSLLTKTIAVPGAVRADAPARQSKAKARALRPPARASPQGARSAPKRDARSRQRDACIAAQAEQQRALDALGLERTFDQLRASGDKVQAACKGL